MKEVNQAMVVMRVAMCRRHEGRKRKEGIGGSNSGEGPALMI